MTDQTGAVSLRFDTRQRVADVLAGLGDSVEAVADSLRRDGVTGTAEDYRRCPIANRLRRELPAGWRAEVIEDFACIMPGDGTEIRVPNPAPVRAFVEWYDQTARELRRATLNRSVTT
jgi:hypothetical protein